MLENRQKTGFDQYLPGSGLLIWHVDDSVGSVESNDVNEDENHKRVDMEEADGRDDLDMSVNYGDYTDPYYPGNATRFEYSTAPNSRLYSGEDSGVRIVGASNSADNMVFDMVFNADLPPVEDVVVELTTGWNLISLYMQPVDAGLSSVLSTIEGKYDSIWAYDAVAGKWQKYEPDGLSFLNDLNKIEAGKGYWVMMNQPGTLVTQGTPPASTIQLKAGWNLIGYNSQSPISISDYLSIVADTCNAIWTYDSGAGQWLRYDADAPSFLNSLNDLKPGSGYWVDVSSDCVWNIAYKYP